MKHTLIILAIIAATGASADSVTERAEAMQARYGETTTTANPPVVPLWEVKQKRCSPLNGNLNGCTLTLRATY